jgi:hypothetical protein
VYNLSVSNQSKELTIAVSDGDQIRPGGGWMQGNLGNMSFSTQQYGTLNLLDIADTHIPGDSKETWGVLISYQGEEIVGRYEGQGQLFITFNTYGQAHLEGMDLRQVSLPSMTFGLPTKV